MIQILKRFLRHPSGIFAFAILLVFFLIAAYAPFLASSKPLCVVWDGNIYFPLFRYLLSSTFFTKKIDLFFNLVGIFLPLILAVLWLPKRLHARTNGLLLLLFAALFSYFGFFKVLDPAESPYLNRQKEALILQLNAISEDVSATRQTYQLPSWHLDLEFSNKYAQLNLVLKERSRILQNRRIQKELHAELHNPSVPPPTLYQIQKEDEEKEIAALQQKIAEGKAPYDRNRKEEELLRLQLRQQGGKASANTQQRILSLEEENSDFEELQNQLRFIQDKRQWLEREQKLITFIAMPLIRPYHWEDDVGGQQSLNLRLPFIELSRINHQDLMAGLIFGSRISLFVGVAATLLALIIGVPLGLVSGYYGSRLDIILCRFVEVWDAMPVFFMLLLVVAIMQTKSIFVVIAVLSVFSWMSSFRFIRAETFRQRQMLYVDAAKALGFGDLRILLVHILPNSLLAVLALLPFDIMAAITREAGLAFLGLGEEQSCSWGVLMDEGRQAFPAQSNLLWPPAIILTILLVAIAFIGEALQEALDPKSDLGS